MPSEQERQRMNENLIKRLGRTLLALTVLGMSARIAYMQYTRPYDEKPSTVIERYFHNNFEFLFPKRHNSRPQRDSDGNEKINPLEREAYATLCA